MAAALVIDVLLQAADDLGAALVVSTHDPAISSRLPTRMGHARRLPAHHRGHGRRSEGSMTRLWLAGLLRRRPGPAAGRRRRGGAIAVALLASLGSFLARFAGHHDRPGCTHGAPSTGRSRSHPDATTAERGPPGHRKSGRAGAAPPSGSPRPPACRSPPAPAPKTPAPAWCSGCHRITEPCSPPRSAPSSAPTPGCCSPSRPPRTCTPRPGDTITIGRAGLPPAPVMVAGVVDLPQANSLFQNVGAPTGAQPTAPPDNVVLLPDCTVASALRSARRGARPDLVSTQIHVQPQPRPAAQPRRRLRRGDRRGAQSRGPQRRQRHGRRQPRRRAGRRPRRRRLRRRCCSCSSGCPARSWLPLLTATVASAGAGRRRAEQALLRARGASAAPTARLAGIEAAVVGVIGAVLGLARRRRWSDYLAFGSGSCGATVRAALAWHLGAAARRNRGRRRDRAAAGPPRPARTHHRRRADGNRRPALPGVGTLRPGRGRSSSPRVWCSPPPPEPATSWSWLPKECRASRCPTGPSPARRCCGSGLRWRPGGPLTCSWDRAGSSLAHVPAPVHRPAGRHCRGNGMSRQRRPLVRAIVLLALAIAFAASTATFNATYRQQAEADAQLTNGADVTVTPAPGTSGAAPAPRARSRRSRGAGG